MKKILVLAGGSGPTQLLVGLYENKVMDYAKVQVLISAYDNGLSTGQCRQIFGGRLLGPSDVRKNALMKYKLIHGKDDLARLLDIRFSIASTEAQAFVLNKIDAYNVGATKTQIMHAAVNTFFEQPLASTIDYNDFSLANLIYAGVAAQNNLSLITASKIMSRDILEIEEDFVLINSDESIFINAVTKSGKILTDEVDIDEWDDILDRVDHVFFTDPQGNNVPPSRLCDEAFNAIVDADIIIYSSGTQWTSLIPTYMSTGFQEALSASKAKQYLVMNNEADTDMTGLTSEEVVDVLSDYLPMNDIMTIINEDAIDPAMRIAPLAKNGGFYKCVKVPLSNHTIKSFHNGSKLVHTIMSLFFQEPIESLTQNAVLLLDFDDTIVGRNGSYSKVSDDNKQYIKQYVSLINSKLTVVTGNSIRSIPALYPGMSVVADNSCNEYISVASIDSSSNVHSRFKLKRAIKDSLIFDQTEIDAIINLITSKCGIDVSKITNKGFGGIGIKPVVADYRVAMALLIRMLIDPDEKIYKVLVSGRTTIDIYKVGVTKMNAVNKFLSVGSVVFVGDEWSKGNDADVFNEYLGKREGLLYVKVDDPSDTALFLSTILYNKKF